MKPKDLVFQAQGDLNHSNGASTISGSGTVLKTGLGNGASRLRRHLSKSQMVRRQPATVDVPVIASKLTLSLATRGVETRTLKIEGLLWA